MMSTMEEEPAIKIRRELEDGELTDSDGEVDYTPLARPDNLTHFNPVSIMSMNIRDDVSSESEQEPSSEDDSDSDNPSYLLRAKKPKIKIKKRQRADSMQSNKMDKYKIWCKTAGEDTLTENLVGCDVARNKLQYGVESYTRIPRYSNSYNEFNGNNHHTDSHDTDKEMVIDRHSNTFNNRKRNYSNRDNTKLGNNRRSSRDSDQDKGEARHIEDLIVGLNSPDEDIAKEVAENLSEKKADLILRMVQILGKQKLFELYKETKRIEEDGGMMIMNGRRRRTPGGVLIFLLKRDRDITEDKLKLLFEEEKKKEKELLRNKRDHEVQQLKQSLTDGGIPTLRTRAEQWAAKNSETPSDSNHVSNPPPSPVTDGRDCSSDADPNHFSSQALPAEGDIDIDNARTNSGARVVVNNLPVDPRAAVHTSYEDDCIDVMCNDDMELF